MKMRKFFREGALPEPAVASNALLDGELRVLRAALSFKVWFGLSPIGYPGDMA